MKVIRKTFPKIRTYIRRKKRRYEVDARGYGVGHRYYFTDKILATKKAQEVSRLVFSSSKPTLEVDLFQKFPWDQLVDKISQKLRIPVMPSQSPLIEDLLKEWINHRQNDKLKPLRPRGLTSIKFMGNKFGLLFKGLMIHEVTPTKIESVFAKLEVGAQSLIHYRSYLSQFFNWAIRRGVVEKNPLQHVQVARPIHEVEIYTMEQVKGMLTLCKSNEDFHGLIPFIVLGLFGGCRPFEVEQMTWEDNIHWNHKEIEIQSEITKTKRPRRFTMEPLLVEWLEWFRCRYKDAPLIPPNFKRRLDKYKKSLPFDWIPDGLRHTFGSYHYNRDKNLGGLTFIMGNSEAVARKHYLTTLPQQEVGEYWSCKPQR